MANAGDKTFSFGLITIDTDGRCRIRLAAQLLDKDGTAHPVGRQEVDVPMTEALASRIATLRASIEAAVQEALPADLTGATAVPATTREDLRAARTAAREAARAERAAARPEHR